ncbi:MAG: hypothetical protein J6D03_00960 [Clostridia bacterium]|nr:hypothetical protein [Clostridia bacterium]
MTNKENIYYVYEWYFKSTGEVFHVGKGKDNRYLERVGSRNNFFKSIVTKYTDDVDSRIVKNNMFEDDAWSYERELIAKYKSIGQCKTNFHIGGKEGFTGNTPERSRKLSIAASKRIGSKNSMYGKTHTPEAIAKIKAANTNKHLSKEHIEKLRKANTGRIKSPEEIEKLRKANIGKIITNEHYFKMMKADCKQAYKIYVNDILVYKCLGHTKLWNFCKEKFNISRVLVRKIIAGNFKAKFNKHKYLENIKIEIIYKSVSTNWDEFTNVEWRLIPFEVRNNQEFYFG